MKKFLLILSFFLCFSPFYSQTLMNETFTVLPKDVYIGDLIEIRYSFTTNINLTDDLSLELTLPESSDYQINSVTLSGTNGNYTLQISCIPWKVGNIDIPKIDLSEYSETVTTSFAIDIPSITVLSIVEQTEKKDIRPIIAPQLIPGTTWIIYIGIIIIILLVVLLVYFLLHAKSIVTKYRDFSINRVAKRNLRKTTKQLKKLNKKATKYTDKDFAKALSQISRQFLTTRFSKNFYSVSSSKIYQEINEVFCDLLPDEIIEKIETISNILSRCDYIRFSGEETDSAKLSFTERSELTFSLIEAFTILANQRSIEC